MWFWTAPRSPWRVRHSSSRCALVYTHILKGDTLSAVGTSWEHWKKTTGEILQKKALTLAIYLFWETFRIHHVFPSGCWSTCRRWETTSCWRLETLCTISTRLSSTKFWKKRAGSSWLSSTCSCKRLSDSVTLWTAAGSALFTFMWFTSNLLTLSSFLYVAFVWHGFLHIFYNLTGCQYFLKRLTLEEKNSLSITLMVSHWVIRYPLYSILFDKLNFSFLAFAFS